MSIGGFSSSGCVSNQAKEGTEDIQGSKYSTGGNYSQGMSSSGSVNNQANFRIKKKIVFEDDIPFYKILQKLFHRMGF